MSSFLGLVRVLFFGLLVSSALADGYDHDHDHDHDDGNNYGNNKGCQKPKVRREWRKLSDGERADWIEAVNCLSHLPHDPKLTPVVPLNVSLIPPVNPNSSFYDDLVYVHMDLSSKIHFTGMFLPWHRYYVQYLEDVLKGKCGYKGVQPYWDWSIDAPDFGNSKFFDHSSSGVGGWGDPENDFQISTGGFKDMIVAYPNPHHIRRNYSVLPLTNPNLSPPFGRDPTAPRPPPNFFINTTMTKKNVDFVTDNFEGDYFGFQKYFESTVGVHLGAHLIIGGDLTGFCPLGAPANCIAGTKWTPNDPLFFMHHAMVDKIWYDWQKKSPKSKIAFGGGSLTPTANFATFSNFSNGLPPYLGFDSLIPGDGMWGNVTVWDVLDTTGGELCYVYE